MSTGDAARARNRARRFCHPWTRRRLARAAILGACDAMPAALLYSRPPPRPVSASKDPHSPIADRPASEMSLETNILHHLAGCLERKYGLAPGDITMTSPTQNEEADLGFDALVGQPDGRYVALQFKRPTPPSSAAPFSTWPTPPSPAPPSFRIPAKQVQALSWWPPSSAFFVLPAIRTNRDLWAAGVSLLGMSRIVDVWDLHAPFREIGLLGPGRSGRSESAGRSVCVAEDGSSAEIHATRGTGRAWRDLRSSPISCLCGTCPGGIVVENGEARTWDGRKWDRDEWQREAEEAWRRLAKRDAGNSGVARSEHACEAWIRDMAGIVWSSHGAAGDASRKRSLRDTGHAYLLRTGGLRSGKK